ncbi:MAG: class I SAM-dependent methyltransferase [Nanoarchaeota archaeon]
MNERNWDKISQDYYTEILSPLKNSVDNPLFDDLEKLKDKDKKVIDLGCGLGEFEEYLSKRFKEILAIDFSKEMIESAIKNNNSLRNVKFEVADMTNLNFKNEFDIAFSINSLISENISNIDKMLENVHNLLKENGKFIAVLPAMEVYAFQSLLIVDKELKEGKGIEEARQKAREFIKTKEHDFLLGIYNFGGKQKAFYNFEINWRLKKAGFKNIKIKRVFYSWEEFKEAGQSYFPGEDLPWDWYVICEK